MTCAIMHRSLYNKSMKCNNLTFTLSIASNDVGQDTPAEGACSKSAAMIQNIPKSVTMR